MIKKNRLTYAVFIVMLSTLLSRLVGFIREMLLPNMLTIGVQTDAYNNAFIMPDLMYSLLLGGAVSAALIPVLSGYIDTDNEIEGWEVVSNFINTVFIVMIILCILGVIFSKELMYLLISGSDKEETRELAAKISRILFPSIAFLMLAGILNGVLNSYKKFAAAALGPIIYNIGSALSIYFLSRYGVDKIAYGVLFSAFAYFITVLAFTIKDLKHYKPVLSYKSEKTKKLFKLAIPSFLSASVVQVNIIVSMKFANYFEEGNVTAFKLADRTWQMPYGILAVSLGIALLPTLSGIFAKKDIFGFSRLIEKSMKYILTMILPCSMAFIVLNQRVIATLFKFSSNLLLSDIDLISMILLIFSSALITQSIIAILNRIFYSMQNTKIPLFTGAVTIAMNISISYTLYKFTDLGINGIALSYSFSSFVNMVMLIILLKYKVREISLSNLLKYFIKILPPLFGMGACLYLLNNYLPVQSGGVDLLSKLSQIGYLGAISVFGVFVYFGLIIFFKIPEGIEVYNKICEKLNLKRLVINVK